MSTVVVYKYQLEVTHRRILINPSTDWKLLSLQLQDRVPTLWLLVNPDLQVTHRVVMVGTGYFFKLSDFVPKVEPLGSVQIGSFVWHYFLERKLG